MTAAYLVLTSLTFSVLQLPLVPRSHSQALPPSTVIPRAPLSMPYFKALDAGWTAARKRKSLWLEDRRRE